MYHNSVAILLGLLLFLHADAIAQVGTCEKAEAEAILEAGNIKASIYNNGPLFWRGGQNLYEAPKGDSVNAVFATTFQVAGMIDNEIRAAASDYGPYEFWPGPLDAQGNPPADCSEYDRIWEINSEDFAFFDQEGVFSPNMLNWPWELGAPVIDGDGNPDNYDLQAGDRPELLGNQMLWWIMNDRGNEHAWSVTSPIGLEIHGTAFAFENIGIGGDITFYRYRIINKNTSPLINTFVGIFMDIDLGAFQDDLVGSDSLLHLGYGYNGDSFDERGYKDKPPAVGYTFLQLPVADVDAFDNDRDGEVDEPGERAGMYAMVKYERDPNDGLELYNYLSGKWFDSKPITIGGEGRNFSEEPTRFMFSGDPYTQSYWSEMRALPNEDSPNPPGDRRLLVSGGPFTLQSDESSYIVGAIIWAQGDDFLDSVRKLERITANMQATPDSFLVSGYRPVLSSPPPPEPEFILGFDQNFPNPFTGTTTFRYSLPKTMQVRLAVYDVLGREVAVLTESSQESGIYAIDFDGTSLPPGTYFARIEVDHLRFTKLMVLVP